jgi:hypothetical protein
MNTWPVAVYKSGERTFIGIPDRLGDGQRYREVGRIPSLEEVCGDEWSSELLSRLLPTERAWAWWTRTEVFQETHLPSASAPALLDLRALTGVRSRRLFLRRMTLAIIPRDRAEEQKHVLQWAGQDTEQIPDHIWTAPNGIEMWDVKHIISWCSHRSMWSNPALVAQQPAERILVMFDGYVFCALTPEEGERAIGELSRLAESWKLHLIPGAAEYAWIIPPR